MICAVLALGTAALYWPVTHHPFIVFDDEQYVSANPHVTTGLSVTNFIWAFTTSEQANWHPLTWLSHQLDCMLFGLNAGAHHFVNLLYHIANSLLLFLFLRSATGFIWRSALVAALFAWHPLHVESVAWVAERKDVLSTFFWLLTLLAYLRYARSLPGDVVGANWKRNPAPFYFLALVFCACGLMSKPMVVTLPFVLLLLDFWPLNRIASLQLPAADSGGGRCGPISLGKLVLEKVPFFVLIIGSSLVTYLVQAGGGAVAKTNWIERLANAALAYARYVSKTFWPVDLAIVYPHPKHWPVMLALGAGLALAAWTLVCVVNWRKKPYLSVGWFWFLGTLVPTIGVIQVGAQSMADRYTYIPSIGLFIVVVWGVAELFSVRESGKIVSPVFGGSALLGCLVATSMQINLWRDSIALFRHTVEVTSDNYSAENTLGKAYEKSGDAVRALACYRLSVETEPRFPNSQFNLAMGLLAAGQTAEGLEHLQSAAALVPREAEIQYALGMYFSQYGAWTNALNCFSNSVAVRPANASTQLALGGALANLGQAAGAAKHLREAVRLDSHLSVAQTNLDRLLTEHPELR